MLSRHPHCLDFPPFWSGQGKFFNPSMEEFVEDVMSNLAWQREVWHGVDGRSH